MTGFLERGTAAGLVPARGFGASAADLDVMTAEVCAIHESALLALLDGVTMRARGATVKRAAIYLTAAVTPIEDLAASRWRGSSRPAVALLVRRAVDLAVSRVGARVSDRLRSTAERALREQARHHQGLARRSARLQARLQRLSRQVLTAQEDERRKISRELHDVIAQTLTGIDYHLAALRGEGRRDAGGLDAKILLTQQLVQRSIRVVHQFARDLRPAALDDLGLIPALEGCMQRFTTCTGVRTRLTAPAATDQLDIGLRTMLFRVAQEALTNIGRHASATHATVALNLAGGSIRMDISDDGRGFAEDRVVRDLGERRMGLLGMRERIELAGGTLRVHSIPGKGTTVSARIPCGTGMGNQAEAPTKGPRRRTA